MFAFIGPSVTDESATLEGLISGDPHATKEVERWIRGVVYCRFNRLSHLADDIIQETVVQVYEKVSQPGFKINKSLKAFVRHVAMCRCIGSSNGRIDFVENETLDKEPAGEPSTVAQMERDEVNRMVGNSISQLSYPCRQIIKLHYFDKVKLSDIAASLKRSENTMKVRLFNCRKNMREAINRTLKDLDWSLGDLLGQFGF